MQKNIFFTQKIREYQGKYVAIADGKVVASGKNAKDVFFLGERMAGKVEGIYYIPQKKDLLTALCVFHISS